LKLSIATPKRDVQFNREFSRIRTRSLPPPDPKVR
jgi:hypothetical protein